MVDGINHNVKDDSSKGPFSVDQGKIWRPLSAQPYSPFLLNIAYLLAPAVGILIVACPFVTLKSDAVPVRV